MWIFHELLPGAVTLERALAEGSLYDLSDLAPDEPPPGSPPARTRKQTAHGGLMLSSSAAPADPDAHAAADLLATAGGARAATLTARLTRVAAQACRRVALVARCCLRSRPPRSAARW